MSGSRSGSPRMSPIMPPTLRWWVSSPRQTPAATRGRIGRPPAGRARARAGPSVASSQRSPAATRVSIGAEAQHLAPALGQGRVGGARAAAILDPHHGLARAYHAGHRRNRSEIVIRPKADVAGADERPGLFDRSGPVLQEARARECVQHWWGNVGRVGEGRARMPELALGEVQGIGPAAKPTRTGSASAIRVMAATFASCRRAPQGQGTRGVSGDGRGERDDRLAGERNGDQRTGTQRSFVGEHLS